MTASESGDIIRMACLGRPFTMGMLYDCRKDALVPGMTLWSSETLNKALNTTKQVEEGYDIIAEDSLESKALNLDISADLKLSFLSGLVEVQGSAKYLDNHTLSMEQSRISLKYWSTSRFDQLTMEQLGQIEYPNVFSQKIATHVVVGILYGADAFFVFDRKVEKGENKQLVSGTMKAVLNETLAIIDNIRGSADLKLTAEDRKKADLFQCKFHGDLHLESNPTTFESAMKVFQDLPKIIKQSESLTPKKVWLYPLIKLNDTAAKIVHEIGIGVVRQAQDVMEELLQLENQTNDLLSTTVSSYFSDIQGHLSSFKARLNEYKLNFTRRLNHLLPKIREGGEEESALVELLQMKCASPFASTLLETWMKKKQQEVKVLEGYFQVMRGITSIELALSPGDLDAILSDFNIERVICFSFNVISNSDPFIEEMLSFLRQGKKTSADLDITSWSSNKEVVRSLRQKVQQFTEFAAANKQVDKASTKFVVTNGGSATVPESDGAEILLCEDGILYPFSPPTKPKQLIPPSNGVRHDSVKLEWTKPVLGSDSITNYIVSYQEKDSAKNWKTVKTEGMELWITVRELKPLTAYRFKVQAECNAGVSLESETITISTVSPPNDRLAMQMMKKSTPIANKKSTKVSCDHKQSTKPGSKDSSWHLSVYKLPQREIYGVPDQMIRTVEVGNPPSKDYNMISHKVLMVVGATGAGKSTLINGMVNYILKVQWKDDFRFKLIVDDGVSQTKSVTTEITAYTLHYMEDSSLPYSITIIDTPGFGDTAGIHRDKEITEQIKYFFSLTEKYGIDHLDGIGFVTQSTLVRLTATQQYIFDSMLAVFGNDVAENIFIMITFCDGNIPPVIAAIDEARIPYSQYFKFNNSALYADNSCTDDDNFAELFWKMGISSFKKFFGAFQQARSVSLTLTQQVLENRAKLEAVVQGLQRQMNACLAEMMVLHKEETEIKKHEAELEANKHFEYKIKVPYYEAILLKDNEYVTNCIHCNYTCHFPCKIPDSDDKYRCASMNCTWRDRLTRNHESITCTVCSGKCSWKLHKNTRERFELRHRVETKTSEDLKKKFDDAASGKSRVERMVQSHARKLCDEHAKLHALIGEARQCLEVLNRIALKPNPLTQVDYIQILIESEKRQAREGWSDRVDYLEKTKEQAVLLTIVTDDIDIDKRIEQEKQQQRVGWEHTVQELEKIKQIKHTIDQHQVSRSELLMIAETVSADMALQQK